jgi:hypothetical protein
LKLLITIEPRALVRFPAVGRIIGFRPYKYFNVPKSIFINEEPPSLAELIEQTIRLWREEAELRPRKKLGKLWLVASELMDKDQRRKTIAAIKQYQNANCKMFPEVEGWKVKLPPAMSAADAKLLIINGDLVPASWKSRKPYPYLGLFVSAFYLIEAKNQLDEDLFDAAWASLAEAKYYLGMNSPPTPSEHEANSKRASIKHEESNSVELRRIIVQILSTMSGEKTIKSAAEAFRRVVSEIELCHAAVLEDYNSRTPDSPKDPKTSPSERLFRRLEEWSNVKDNLYPDIVEAALPFKRKYGVAKQ